MNGISLDVAEAMDPVKRRAIVLGLAMANGADVDWRTLLPRERRP